MLNCSVSYAIVQGQARLAQLVERVIDVDDVTGSNPVSRTN